jgi:hypothetical protein
MSAPRKTQADSKKSQAQECRAMVLCEQVAARCSICGAPIDEAGTCNNQHQLGQSYSWPR